MEANNPDLKQDSAQKDDFKWFGEGFDGFPKRLPDDCMEYSIFIIDSRLRGSHQEFERRERLKKIQAKGNSLLKSPLLKDYIWQRERFNLDLIDPKLTKPDTTSKDKDTVVPDQYFLHGRTNFGDSIADEWLIVWLLLELSRTFPTAWIQVRDSDGEFLLVEAANALPKWLEPDLADNRVWMNRGALKIIPLAREAGIGSGPRTPGLPGEITTSQALNFVTSTEKSVLHSPLIEAEAFYRLKDFPAAINEGQHRSLLSIPRNLAYILHKNPSYISPAIEAFYLRDPIAIRPLSTKDTATLLFSPEDFVTVPAHFPKVAYAQLHSQEFGVPPAWTAVKPRLSQKPVEMGMKLSCGFEMLIRDPQNRDKRVVREINMLLEDIEEDGSILPSTSEIETWDMTVDDDKWLDIDFKDFEKELSGKGEKGGNTDAEAAYGEGDPATQQNLKNMVSRFEKFLNDEDAGPDGARFSSASDSGSGSDSDSNSDSENEDGDEDADDEGEDKAASFTDAEFEKAMREMMGMPDDVKESTGLYADARKLALEMEDEEEMERDEEAEAEEVWKLMLEKQAAKKASGSTGQSAAQPGQSDTNSSKEKGKGKAKAEGRGNVRFANDTKGKGKATVESYSESEDEEEDSDEEDIIQTTDELSSDEDEDIMGDMDYTMLKNLLESYKGQAGVSGPAGNLMGLMGMGNLPRD